MRDAANAHNDALDAVVAAACAAPGFFAATQQAAIDAVNAARPAAARCAAEAAITAECGY